MRWNGANELLEKLDRRFADSGKGRSVAWKASISLAASPFDDHVGIVRVTHLTLAKRIPALPNSLVKISFGQSCLLALRLVESGVRFASVQLGGWDTHIDNFTKLKTNNLPKLDAGFSGLLAGLEQRGLLDSTAVLVTGEFGRTPKINDRSAEGGRDHYPRCMFMLMAGGGVRGGQVIGESDDTASGPRHEGISPDDVAARFYHTLGIDPSLEYDSNTGRPINLVRDGTVIDQLFS